MSHKASQKILRIFQNEDWDSRGFYKKNMPHYLEEDFKIRKFLNKKLPKGIIESIEIERDETTVRIIIKTSRPALVIGRGGEGVTKLRNEIEEIIKGINRKRNYEEERKAIKIEILSVKDPWSSANLTAWWVALQLEKRMPYRRALKMALNKIMVSKEVKGARIRVSGRLNGVDISRKEWLQEGRLPRNRFRANIEYGFAEANCTYGAIGVKVWIYKGEKEKI